MNPYSTVYPMMMKPSSASVASLESRGRAERTGSFRVRFRFLPLSMISMMLSSSSGSETAADGRATAAFDTEVFVRPALRVLDPSLARMSRRSGASSPEFLAFAAPFLILGSFCSRTSPNAALTALPISFAARMARPRANGGAYLSQRRARASIGGALVNLDHVQITGGVPGGQPVGIVDHLVFSRAVRSRRLDGPWLTRRPNRAEGPRR